MDDSEKFYLGKTLLDADTVAQITDIIKNIIQDFNLNGVHNDACDMENNEPCGINADRVDDFHAKDFVQLIDPDYPDNPLNNQELIRNSLQQGRTKIGNGKELWNDVILRLDTSDIDLLLDLNNVEESERDKAFFENNLELTNVIHKILYNLWELRDSSFMFTNEGQDLKLWLDMYSPYSNDRKAAGIIIPPRNEYANGLMMPGDVQNIINNRTDIDELYNIKVDKVPGKDLSENDFSNEYVEIVNKLDNDYTLRKNSIRHFLITEDLYNDDDHMIVHWDDLNEIQRDNLPQEILDLPVEDRYYDPRTDVYNNYYFVDEIPASYMPPQFDTQAPFEFGIDQYQGEPWMYYTNINSNTRHYFLKVADILTKDSLTHVLDKNILLQFLSTITNQELDDQTQFMSKSKEPKLDSAVQGASLNGVLVPKNDNVLFFNNVVTGDLLKDEMYNIDGSNLLNNAITTNKIADNAITEQKIINNSISTNKLKDNSVTEPKIANNSVSTDKVKDKSITEQKITDEAVTRDKIATESITNNEVAIDAGIHYSKLRGVAPEHHQHAEGTHMHGLGDIPNAVIRSIREGFIATGNQVEGFMWQSGVFAATNAEFSIGFEYSFNKIEGVILQCTGGPQKGWHSAIVSSISNTRFGCEISIYDELGDLSEISRTFRWFAWGR